jgi:hypothetical protein
MVTPPKEQANLTFSTPPDRQDIDPDRFKLTIRFFDHRRGDISAAKAPGKVAYHVFPCW